MRPRSTWRIRGIVARLDEPMLALEPLRGLVVIDEIQHRPALFPVLRVLADRRPLPARFLVLGSASPELLRQGSESLAGRVAYHDLDGLALDEVGNARWERLWLRGAFPRAFLADSDEESAAWRRDYVRSLIQRDLPGLGISLPARLLYDFFAMLAHYHGQIWNASELARAFGISHTTVRRYVDYMTGLFLVRQLRPWRGNLASRIVKSPKLYVADSSILHTLLGTSTPEELRTHPKVGASWEGFALTQVIHQLRARPEECYFWAIHGGPELDLLVVRGNLRLGFEFKRTDSPRVTRSMRSAMTALQLDRLEVIHVGKATFDLGERMRAVGADDLAGVR